MRPYILFTILVCFTFSCGKNRDTATPPVVAKNPALRIATIDNRSFDNTPTGISSRPIIKLLFSEPLKQTSLAAAIQLTDASNAVIPISATLQNGDSGISIQPNGALGYLVKYKLTVSSALQSASSGGLISTIEQSFSTALDSSAKFPAISDSELLDKVQKQTFKYFWDFGHPVSGLARERSNGDNEVVTTGGSGFGIMAMLAAVNRGFITREEAFERLQKTVAFLKNKAENFHGTFPHWLNGTTGKVVPFSREDDGADLVETSFLIQGLLCARQYFNENSASEFRNDVDTIYRRVEWSWFQKNNEDVLYWHWSPNYGWAVNLPIRGWNECLITYVLAASSPSYPIAKKVYDNGWAQNGAIKNNLAAYGVTVPLGTSTGGPLFFSHYSFLGINPNGLVDAYANYETQVISHSKVNYNYCVANPNKYFGYSTTCWGLTASDIYNGYTASSPTNDVGYIAPTAALSSIAFTPDQSKAALQFFYYTLGDKLFKEYGFVDAFSLHQLWFANSFLAIDQGPIIVMIENYRSGLLWNLFMSCPEIKLGMKGLGFSSPHL